MYSKKACKRQVLLFNQKLQKKNVSSDASEELATDLRLKFWANNLYGCRERDRTESLIRVQMVTNIRKSITTTTLRSISQGERLPEHPELTFEKSIRIC